MFQVQKLEGMAVGLVRALGIALFALLCVTSLVFTRFFHGEYEVEIPFNQIDFFLLTVLGTVILGALVLWLGSRLTCRSDRTEKNLKILLFLVLLWTLAAGFLWNAWAVSTPGWDQYMVYDGARGFLRGDYSALEHGSYLYCYPHQLGLASWEALVLGICGADHYQAIQAANVLWAALCVYAGYRITRFLTDSARAAAVYLLLMASCFQLFIYTAYIYNDVMALALCMTAIWQFLRWMRGEKKSGAVLTVLFTGAAVLIRNNSVVVMIAFLCVLGVKTLAKKRWQYLIWAAVLLLFCLGSGAVLRQYYEQKADISFGESSPTILWITMAMQEGYMEAGWYNDYVTDVYNDMYDYDADAAAEKGFADAAARIEEFLEEPLYALDFYSRKFTSQWTEPTYGCFIMTYATENERTPWAESLYTGWPNRILQKYMDSFQLLIYGLTFLFLTERRRRDGTERLESYVLLIVVIGGVLFHQIWEAKSRYVFPYFIMMFPMAATGLAGLPPRIQGFLAACVRRMRPQADKR